MITKYLVGDENDTKVHFLC